MQIGKSRQFKDPQKAKAFSDKIHADGGGVHVCLACDSCGVKAPGYFTRWDDSAQQIDEEVHRFAQQVGFVGDFCAECSGAELPEGCEVVTVYPVGYRWWKFWLRKERKIMYRMYINPMSEEIAAELRKTYLETKW